MKFEVLFRGDEGIYIIKKDNYFYTIDILEDIKPMKSQYAETFLKFGGFEAIENVVGEDVRKEIENRLTKYKSIET